MADPVSVNDAQPVAGGDEVEIVSAAARQSADLRAADILAAIPEAVIGVDRDGRIQVANTAAAELFGYAIDRLVGGSIHRLLPKTVRSRHRSLIASFFANPVAREMGSGLPLAAQRRGGEVFFADISLAPIDSALGMLALITVRDVSEHRRERLIAAQYLTTQALAESETLVDAAGAVLEAIGPASGANIAALWAVGGDGAARYVDSWRATEREQPFHAASIDFVFPPGFGLLGSVVADPGVRWMSDVTTEPDFHRKQLATDLGLHAGAWLPFLDGHGHVLGVLELLFGVVRDPDPGMLRILESFAGQLAQYLALRRSEADRQRVLGQIVRSVEDERRRIASELHDDTVQVLIATLLSIDRVRRAMSPENARAIALLERVRETLATATERTRHLIFDLRPQLLEAEGVMPAIAEVAAVAGREAGFEAEVIPARMRFDPSVEALLYRMMQEAIVNARKHARARHVRCTLHRAHDGVLAEVADDGVGFHVESAIDGAHQRLSFGLSTLVELVRLAGGRVDIESMPGDGSTVRIWLPLRLRAAAAP